MIEKTNKTNHTPPTRAETVGYAGLYLERAGYDIGSMVEALEQAPTRPLKDCDKRKAYDFERELIGRQVTSGKTIEEIIRESARGDTHQSLQYLFLHPLVDGAVTSDQIEIPKFSSTNEAYVWFVGLISDQNIDRSVIKDIRTATESMYKKAVQDALLTGQLDESLADKKPVILNPEESIQKTRDLMEARGIIREERSKHTELSDDDLDGAKRAFSDVYMARINELAAGDIVIMDALAQQAAAVGDESTVSQAESLIPGGLRRALAGKGRDRVFRRIDFLRNGIRHVQKERLSQAALGDTVAGGDIIEKPMFTREQTEILKATLISPQRIFEHTRNILRRGGFLNEERISRDDSRKLKRPRIVGKYQVPDPEAPEESFSIDAARGLHRVPARERSLYDCLAVEVHELAHILQAAADRAMSSDLKIAGLRGKRVLATREAGADAEQRSFERNTFGRAKGYSRAYSDALTELDTGGSTVDAAEVFYKTILRETPTIDPVEAARLAADRVLRLIRLRINSQPLNYWEESNFELSMEGYSTQLKKRATAVTCLDIVDQARLHRYGLLPEIPKLEDIDWVQIVLDEYDSEIKAALGTIE